MEDRLGTRSRTIEGAFGVKYLILPAAECSPEEREAAKGDPMVASDLLAAMRDPGGNARATIAEVLSNADSADPLGMHRLDDLELLRLLQHAIERGEFVVARLTRPTVSHFASSPRKEPPAPPPRRAPVSNRLVIRFVDEIGVAIPGAKVNIAHAGQVSGRTTDGSGVARVDDAVVSSGVATLPELGGVRNALKPRWGQVRAGRVLDESSGFTIWELDDSPPPFGVAAGKIQVVSIQPRVVRARLIGPFFETAKSFLLPATLDAMRSVVSLQRSLNTKRLLVVGHTDTTGTPAYNDRLSLERAKAVNDYLTNNVDGWLAWYGSDKPDEKRWGKREDLLMIGAMPDVSSRDGTVSAVRWYQRTRGLAVDGVAGADTRRALVSEYMAIEGTTLAAGTDVVTHGCGENFPAEPTADGVADSENRRVEVFLFDRVLGVQPQAPGENSKPGSKVYPEWVRRARRTETYAPGSVPYQFIYALPWAPDAPWSDDAIFRILSADGSQRCDFTKSDGESVDGYLAFTFADSRPGVRYRGIIVDHDDTTIELFGPAEIWRLQDPSDPCSDLPLPDPRLDDTESSADSLDLPPIEGADPDLDASALAAAASGGPFTETA